MSAFDFLFNTEQSIEHLVNGAFDSSNHGIFDGRYEDFQLGINRAFGLPTSIISNNLQTFGDGIGKASNSVLTPLSSSPAFYILGIGGILILIITGYTVFKVGKYI